MSSWNGCGRYCPGPSEVTSQRKRSRFEDGRRPQAHAVRAGLDGEHDVARCREQQGHPHHPRPDLSVLMPGRDALEICGDGQRPDHPLPHDREIARVAQRRPTHRTHALINANEKGAEAPALLQQPALRERLRASAGHHDVVEHPHVDHRQRGLQSRRQRLVRTRRTVEPDGWLWLMMMAGAS